MFRFARITICVLAIAVATNPSHAAKKVVCVDHDAGTEDGYLTAAEGWARNQATGGSDVVQLGGNLEDCLAKVEDGDELIIIAHGEFWGARFFWGGNNTYTGFGTAQDEDQGTEPHVVPESFRGLSNVTVRFVTCWSARSRWCGRRQPG